MKALVKKSKDEAQVSKVYWKRLSRKYYYRELFLKIFLALMASGTVASWGFWRELELIWKILSSLSALIAIVLPLLNWSNAISQMNDLSWGWLKIRSDCEILLFEIENGNKSTDQLFKSYKKIIEQVNKLSRKEANLPYDKEVESKSFNDLYIP